MRISRRQFACAVAGAAAPGSVTARLPRIVERRIYAPGSVLPPREILQRHGIRLASVKRQQNGTAYLISFVSAEARVKAWDRFNADEDWRAIRGQGRVALQEIQIYAGS